MRAQWRWRATIRGGEGRGGEEGEIITYNFWFKLFSFFTGVVSCLAVCGGQDGGVGGLWRVVEGSGGGWWKVLCSTETPDCPLLE